MRAELFVLAGLAPYCRVNSGRPVLARIYCSDAPQHGYALATTVAAPAEVRRAARRRERRRFRPDGALPAARGPGVQAPAIDA
eukprot:5794155-Lingulodinium_polyedra.AAC.1